MISKSRLKDILSLKSKKFRTQKNLFLIEGYRLCQEALHSDFKIETLLYNPDMLTSQKVNAISRAAQKQNVEIIEIEKTDVNRLAETVHSQGIFSIVHQKKYNLDSILNKGNELIVIINAGQDPGNVGTIIRTCDWFGAHAIFLTTGTVELFNPKVVRATMGSVFHLPIFEAIELHDLLPILKNWDYHIFGADVNGEFFYHQIEYPTPLALVIGNENRGIDKNVQHFDRTIKIPSHGKAESLNMAVAAAIIISRVIN